MPLCAEEIGGDRANNTEFFSMQFGKKHFRIRKNYPAIGKRFMLLRISNNKSLSKLRSENNEELMIKVSTQRLRFLSRIMDLIRQCD